MSNFICVLADGSSMLGRLCRLCAKPNGDGTEKFIYDVEEEQLGADVDVEMDLAELINTFLPVKVQYIKKKIPLKIFSSETKY